jgi:hypothetical protein
MLDELSSTYSGIDLKTGPFLFKTVFDHLNTILVWYSDVFTANKKVEIIQKLDHLSGIQVLF